MFVVAVPDAGNALANAMMAWALGVTQSDAVDALVTLLNAKKDVVVGVVGHSSQVNIATIKSALKNINEVNFSKKIFVYADTKEKLETDKFPRVQVIVVDPVP